MTRLNVCNAPTKVKGIDKENKHWCQCRMWFVSSCRGEVSILEVNCASEDGPDTITWLGSYPTKVKVRV
jgi:hypothetical protein